MLKYLLVIFYNVHVCLFLGCNFSQPENQAMLKKQAPPYFFMMVMKILENAFRNKSKFLIIKH